MQPIFFNEDVHPVCLGSVVEPPAGTECYVTGWGNTAANRNKQSQQFSDDTFNQSSSSKEGETRAESRLRQVDIKVVSHNACNKALNNVITDDMICASNPGKDRLA